jgi:hypothetical protein
MFASLQFIMALHNAVHCRVNGVFKYSKGGSGLQRTNLIT